MSKADGSSGKPDEVEQDLTGPMRELREYARGTLDVDHSDISHVAGLVDDPKVMEFLLFSAEEYQPRGDMPNSFWDTRFAEDIIRRHATDKATKAIQQGDQSSAAYLTGVPSYESDISGLKAINQLSDWLLNSEQCKVIYAAALMGRGKTDFALLLLQIIHDHYERLQQSGHDAPTPEFACNFYARSPDGVDVDIEEYHNYERFLEWAEQGNSDMERWFIFDEASTELTAQSGANAQDVAEIFAPFVKKMRKMGINMIVIGHDRQDVHPAIRSVASFIDKTGTKTAQIYEGIKRREPYGHRLSLSGIPPTDWIYDTDDVASWEWGDEVVDDTDPLEDRDDLISEDEWEQWRDERMVALYETTSMSYKDIGDVFGVSKSTAGRRIRELRDSGVDIQPAPATPEAAD